MKKYFAALSVAIVFSIASLFAQPSNPVVTQAASIFAAAHPGDSGPSAVGLSNAVAKGATAQQAADAAGFFISNAEFPDATIYRTGYNAWVLDHNAGEGDGYCYGCDSATFNSRYKVSTFLATGETAAMRQAASKPGLTWEQSLAIDPFLDYAYSQKFASAKSAQAGGLGSMTAQRLSRLEAAVFGKK